MEVKTGITGVTSQGALRVFKPVAALIVTADVAFAAEEIKIDKVDQVGGQTESICPSTKILSLFEINAGDDGSFRNYAADGQGAIAIAMDGCLDLGGSKYLNIELSSLNSAKAYNVYALELPVGGGEMIRYEKFQIPAGETTKSIVANGARLLAVPDTNLDHVKLDGREIKRAELRVLSLDSQDIVYESAAGTPVLGYYNIHVVPCVGVGELEVVSDGGAAIEFFIVS